jgi:hypothetical protein
LVKNKNYNKGGGGYNFSNTSKLWCCITGLTIDIDIYNNYSSIPENNNFYEYYKETNFEIKMNKINNKIDNENDLDYLNYIIDFIFENLNKL